MTEFVGVLGASKSLMNRALVAQSFAPELELIGESNSDDVQYMREALEGLRAGARTYACGDAGTVLRFMALRASREPGEHVLTGSVRLFSRPQSELEKVLRQLGCETQLTGTSLRIKSYGWRLQGDGLFISGAQSSQFASAVLLSAWDLPTALALSVGPRMVSQGYWLMTLKLCRQLGMNFDYEGHELIVHPRQSVRARRYEIEIDLSSAFAVAALAAANGRARILNFPDASLQPDAVFIQFMRQMGMAVELQGRQLSVNRTEAWDGLRADLNTCPDLLPVLAVLCAYARTPSELTGLEHLRYKESDRLQKTRELLTLIGARAEVFENGGVVMKITPVTGGSSATELTFHPDHDHRMAMAAAVAREKGARITIMTPEVVNKSFPDFWQIAGAP